MSREKTAMRARWRRAQVGWIALVLAAGTMVGSLGTPAQARVMKSLYCGQYRKWTDGYSGDVVRYRACVQVSATGSYVASSGQSYLDVYHGAKPVNLYHVHVALESPVGSTVATDNCETASLPIRWGLRLLCTTGSKPSGRGPRGWTGSISVCLFYVSGKVDCSPTIAYTY